MLEFAAVLTTGGILLFSNAMDLDRTIFLALVNRIIDSKNLQSSFEVLKLKINYLYDAVLGLIFVIAWRKEIMLDYPDKLLKSMCQEFKKVHSSIIWKDSLMVDAPDFKEPWERAFENWKFYVSKKEEQGHVMKTFDETEKGSKLKKKEEKNKNEADEKLPEVEEGQKTNEQQICDDDLSPRERFLKMQEEKRKSKSPKTKKSQRSPQKEENARRTWELGKINSQDLNKLDIGKRKRNTADDEMKRSTKYEEMTEIKEPEGFLDSDEEVDEEKTSKFFSKWMGKVKNLVGDKKITKEDIEEVMGDFKKKLMEKNVAQEVAEKISEAVGKTLLETKTKSFVSVHKTVNEALKQALRKILTPKRKIDLIVEISKQKEKMKPYVIVFIGVNGVGKSTNLAKVAYKLKNAGFSIMLAACDNFRAGAVEQIKTHGRNLDIQVYDRGYKEEPSNIAFEAIRAATKKRIDVVLVDTAGRMQDNQPLMKELSQIVKINKPNLVVFIGEALVGNDAVDQISKFNKAIEQETTETYQAGIDAILLSKFDTVDDKVGTALSLVYTTSKPILYVGVGQKYPNLKELNVNTIVHSLLS